MTANVTWTTRLSFLLAAVGAAVGLGNIWKFPYMAGTSGGAAFVGIYLICVIAIAIPILIAELMLGRRGRASPPTAVARVADESGRGRAWSLVGWLGAGAGFLIVSFYSVIAGWALAYAVSAARGTLEGLDAAGSAALFDGLLADPAILTLWHTLFMGLTVVIVSRGVNRGIEAAVQVLMPTLFAMLLLMVGYAVVAGDFAAGWSFLFHFELAAVDGGVVLNAIGQAFFSIGVSMGLMMMYGAYLPRDQPIPRYSVFIALADSAVALIAGLAIFPLVFAHGLDPAEGPGLIFVTLPIAFGNMPFGALFGTLFFVLLVFAAITSAIALLQPAVVRIQEIPGVNPAAAAILAGAGAWLLGLVSVLSFNLWGDVHPLGWLPGFAERTPYDVIDYLTANVMMPLGGMLIAVFVGWFVAGRVLHDEFPRMPPLAFRLWRVAVRLIAPLAILLVFIANLA
ncbi:MAG: sodium-dependent transporter [Pseudomonadales bacterium]